MSSVISRVGDFCVLRFYICIYRYGSSLSVYSTLRRILAAVSHTISFSWLYSLLVSSHTNKSTKDNLKFHSQNSSTSSPTTVYFKLAQLSPRKGHNFADSQAHSQAVSETCRCLGWQNRGVSEIGEASPSSSATKQNNFYPVFNCLVLFHHDPNKRYDPKVSVLSEPTTKLLLRCTSMALFPYMIR